MSPMMRVSTFMLFVVAWTSLDAAPSGATPLAESWQTSSGAEVDGHSFARAGYSPDTWTDGWAAGVYICPDNQPHGDAAFAEDRLYVTGEISNLPNLPDGTETALWRVDFWMYADVRLWLNYYWSDPATTYGLIGTAEVTVGGRIQASVKLDEALYDPDRDAVHVETLLIVNESLRADRIEFNYGGWCAVAMAMNRPEMLYGAYAGFRGPWLNGSGTLIAYDNTDPDTPIMLQRLNGSGAVWYLR